MHGLMDENNHYNSPRLYVKAYGMDELPYVFGLKPLKPMDEKNEFLSTVRGNQTKLKIQRPDRVVVWDVIILNTFHPIIKF